MKEYNEIADKVKNVLLNSEIEDRPLTEEEKEELNHPFIKEYIVDPKDIETRYGKYVIDSIAECHVLTYLLGKMCYQIFKHNIEIKKRKKVEEEEFWEEAQKEIHKRSTRNPIKNIMIALEDEKTTLDTNVGWALLPKSRNEILTIDNTSIIHFLPQVTRKDLEENRYESLKDKKFVIDYLKLYLYYIGSDIEDYISKRMEKATSYQEEQQKLKIKTNEKGTTT